MVGFGMESGLNETYERLDEQPTAVRTGAGITVELHPVSSLGLSGLSTSQPPRGPGCH